MNFPNPLNAMQILWINIIMDGPPAQRYKGIMGGVVFVTSRKERTFLLLLLSPRQRVNIKFEEVEACKFKGVG